MSNQDKTPLLPGIFERSMSLDQPAKSGSRAMGLFERMADRLDEIAANTRGGIANMAQPRRRSIAGSEPIRHILGERPQKERLPVLPPAIARQADKSAPSSGAGPKPHAASKKGEKGQPALAREAKKGSASEAGRQGKAEGKARSADALAAARQTRQADAAGNRIEDAIKNGMAKLGNLAKLGGGAIAQQSDAKDAVGYALGGPLYGAMKDLKDTMPNFDMGKRDKEDDKAQAKEIAKAIEGQPGRRRDEKGRFIKPDQNAVRRQNAQTEVMQDQLDLAEGEAKKEAKRHKELVRAVKNNKRGLLDKFLDRRAARGGRGLFGGGKNREIIRERNVGHDARRRRDIDVDARGRRGARAGRRGILSRAGGGLAKAGGAVAGGLMKGVGALGGMLAKAAPMLAAAMAVYDGFKGWNDKELHKQAFGLKDGEEATTGQKASAAAASILDMGGLTSGILEMFGIEFDKAGVAKSIYDFGCNIASVAQGFLETAGPMLQKVWGGIEDFAGKAWQGAKDFGAGVANFATGIWEKGASLVSGIGDFAAGVWEKGTNFVSGVADVAVGVWEKGTGLITSIGEGIGEIGGAIGGFAANMWNKGTELATNVAGWATSAIQEGASILSGIWKGASETVSGIWAGLTNFASSALSKAGQVMSDMWNGVTEGTGKLIDGAKDMAKSAIEGGAELLSDGWKATKDFVGSLWPFGDDEAEAATPKASSSQEKPIEKNETPKQEPQNPVSEPKKPEASLPPELPPVPDAKLLQGQFQDVFKKIPTSSEAASGALALEQMNQKQREDKNQSELSGGLEGINDAITRQTKLFEDRWREEDAEKDPFGIKDAMDATTQQLASMRSGGGGGYGGGYGGSGGGGGGGGGGAVNASMYNPDSKIGDTIAKYESGNAGVNMIGYDRMGGTSYGKWQLSSKTGSYEDWLKHLESKGGKGAEIAAQLRAAGPANTGGRSGQHVDVYKKLAAENAVFFEETQRESLLKNNYNVSMGKIQSQSLRKMIEGDKAIQEMLFSTSVQHGGAGGAKVFNNAWKESMSREDFIKAVYDYRGTQFGGSTAQVQASVRNRFAEERNLILGMNEGEAKVKEARNATQAAMAQGGTAAVNAGMSALTAAATQKALDNNVRYNMGSKNSASGAIDCSGWVAEINRQMMNSMNQAVGQEVFGAEARKTLAKGAAGGAAGIIQTVGEKTGKIYNNAELAPENVKEGMAIGLSLGKHAKGRFRDIGHIVQTYRDPETGEMMVSESTSGGKGGVTRTKYADWYKKFNNDRGVKLHGVDMAALADSSMIVSTQPAAVAENTHQSASPEQITPQADANNKQNTDAAQAPTAPDPEKLKALEVAKARLAKAEGSFEDGAYQDYSFQYGEVTYTREEMEAAKKQIADGTFQARSTGGESTLTFAKNAISAFEELDAAKAEVERLQAEISQPAQTQTARMQAVQSAQAVDAKLAAQANVTQPQAHPQSLAQTSNQQAPESIARTQMQAAVTPAVNTRPPERPESVREINPEREPQQKGQDITMLAGVLGEILQAIQSGNDKLASAIQNAIQSVGSQANIGMDYGDSASRSMAKG